MVQRPRLPAEDTPDMMPALLLQAEDEVKKQAGNWTKDDFSYDSPMRYCIRAARRLAEVGVGVADPTCRRFVIHVLNAFVKRMMDMSNNTSEILKLATETMEEIFVLFAALLPIPNIDNSVSTSFSTFIETAFDSTASYHKALQQTKLGMKHLASRQAEAPCGSLCWFVEVMVDVSVLANFVDLVEQQQNIHNIVLLIRPIQSMATFLNSSNSNVFSYILRILRKSHQISDSLINQDDSPLDEVTACVNLIDITSRMLTNLQIITSTCTETVLNIECWQNKQLKIVSRQFKSANEMGQVTAVRNTIHLLGLTSPSDQFATLVMTSFVDTCKQYMKSLSLEQHRKLHKRMLVECLQQLESLNSCKFTERVLQLIYEYVSQIEAEFGAERCFRRHMHCYHGSALRVNVTMSKRDVRQVPGLSTTECSFALKSHDNETVRSLRQRIAKRMNVQDTMLVGLFLESSTRLEFNDDFSTIGQICSFNNQNDTRATTINLRAETLRKKPRLLFTYPPTLPNSVPATSPSAEELALPSTVFVTCAKVHERLLLLVDKFASETTVVDLVMRVIGMLPLYQRIVDDFNSLTAERSNSNETYNPSNSSHVDAVPLSDYPKRSRKTVSPGNAVLDRIFNVNDSSPYQLLISMQIVESLLMPTRYASESTRYAVEFCHAFYKSGGLDRVVRVIEWCRNARHSTTTNVSRIRRQIAVECITIIRHFVCAESTMLSIMNDERQFETTMRTNSPNRFLGKKTLFMIVPIMLCDEDTADYEPPMFDSHTITSVVKCVIALATGHTSVDVQHAAYQLVESMCVRSATTTLIVCENMSTTSVCSAENMMTNSSTCQQRESSAHQHVGLLNIGNSCFANSVIQQLAHLPQVVEGLLQLTLPPSTTSIADRATESNSRRTFCQLLKTFSALKNGDCPVYDIRDMLSSVMIDGVRCDAGRQTDAYQFFVKLVDTIFTLLKAHDMDVVFKKQFEGRIIDSIISQGCEHQSHKSDEFTTLSLPLDQGGLQAALRECVRGEVMVGDNLWNCGRCDQMRRAVKSTRFEQLPTVLAINIKRYLHNLDGGDRSIKLNGKFEFPNLIDMQPFMYVEDVDVSIAVPHPTEWYALAGVIVHAGDDNNGHYLSYCRNTRSSNQEAWLRCDDSKITEIHLTRAFMSKEFFGGNDVSAGNSNACMIIYEKTTAKDFRLTDNHHTAAAKKYQNPCQALSANVVSVHYDKFCSNLLATAVRHANRVDNQVVSTNVIRQAIRLALQYLLYQLWSSCSAEEVSTTTWSNRLLGVFQVVGDVGAAARSTAIQELFHERTLVKYVFSCEQKHLCETYLKLCRTAVHNHQAIDSTIFSNAIGVLCRVLRKVCFLIGKPREPVTQHASDNIGKSVELWQLLAGVTEDCVPSVITARMIDSWELFETAVRFVFEVDFTSDKAWPVKTVVGPPLLTTVFSVLLCCAGSVPKENALSHDSFIQTLLNNKPDRLAKRLIDCLMEPLYHCDSMTSKTSDTLLLLVGRNPVCMKLVITGLARAISVNLAGERFEQLLPILNDLLITPSNPIAEQVVTSLCEVMSTVLRNISESAPTAIEVTNKAACCQLMHLLVMAAREAFLNTQNAMLTNLIVTTTASDVRLRQIYENFAESC